MDDRVLLRSSEKIEYFPSKMKNNRICMNYSTFFFLLFMFMVSAHLKTLSITFAVQ